MWLGSQPRFHPCEKIKITWGQARDERRVFKYVQTELPREGGQQCAGGGGCRAEPSPGAVSFRRVWTLRRPLSTQGLKLGCHRPRLVTSNTLFFFNRSSSSIKSKTRGSRINPLVPSRMTKRRIFRFEVDLQLEVQCRNMYIFALTCS